MIVIDRDYRHLLSKLHSHNYEYNLTRRRDARLTGTCSWSTDSHPKIREWFLQPGITSTRHLWITGGPGFGKSTLSAYLVEKLQETRSQDEIVLYFFCDSSDRATSVLKSLLVQSLKSTDRSLYIDDLRILQDEILSKADDYAYSIQDLKKCLCLVSKSFSKLW